jgi:cytochrome oxidase Cu insertion factor (SCO1/SenC/PrrC family)
VRYRWVMLASAFVLGVGIGITVATRSSGQSLPPSFTAAGQAAKTNPNLDPGSPVTGLAHNFTLTDQFGRRASLSAFRGKVVVLSFNDPKCTTICPLTTTAMLRAKAMLGPAAKRVQLLGVGANPMATQVKWVRAYSRDHRMTRKWLFLTGSLRQLKRVWREYGIAAEVIRGQIDHTPATYVIDPQGRMSRLYVSQMAYSSVSQLGKEMARSIAALLPGHPSVQGSVSLGPLKLADPHRSVTLPRAGGGVVRLGPGTGPHLVLFFDTWDGEVLNMRSGLESLSRYAATSARHGLPPLVAVDEATVEPSRRTLHHLLHSLPRPLRYPVAIDPAGRVADGYRVQDSPWLTLVSGSGRFLFYYDVSVRGWPTLTWLLDRIHGSEARDP